MAVSGKLSAMFVVSYTANPEIASSLRKMVKQGIGLLVRNQDSNIDAAFIAALFGVTKKAINILSVVQQDLTENKQKEEPRRELFLPEAYRDCLNPSSRP